VYQPSLVDLALQVVGEFLSYFLKKRNKKMTVLVATSGDTGMLIQ
jgi:threonine synthase